MGGRWWYLVDVVPGLGAGLDVGHLPVLRALAARVQRHAALVGQVRLVAHQQERDILVVLHAEDLLPGTNTDSSRYANTHLQ